MEKLNEQIEFLEMTEEDPQLLVWLLELRRHRENNWQQRAETGEAEVQRLNATAHPVSDGCKVPNEPTPEMQTAGATAIRFDTTPVNKLFTANAVYRAMLAAAPGGQGS